jgi:hypothetical protein
MLPDEWATLAPAFIPLRETDGRVTLLSKQHVVAFALPPGVPASDEQELLDVPVRHVVVEMVGGRRFEGNIAVSMPRAQQRLNDWLNTPAPYVVVNVDGRAHLIQKSAITRIQELSQA